MEIQGREVDGREEVVIRFAPGESDALGAYTTVLAEWMTDALSGLVALRTGYVSGDPDAGTPGTDMWERVIRSVRHHLGPHLDGIADAAIRRHAEAGGSYGALADALGRPKSTAQSIRDAVRARPLSQSEEWAIHGGPQQRAHRAETPETNEAAILRLVREYGSARAMWQALATIRSAGRDAYGAQADQLLEEITDRLTRALNPDTDQEV